MKNWIGFFHWSLTRSLRLPGVFAYAPAHAGATFWTDAALLAAAGMDVILLGPVGHGLHSAEEWVDLSSVLDLTYVLAETAVAYCGS